MERVGEEEPTWMESTRLRDCAHVMLRMPLHRSNSQSPASPDISPSLPAPSPRSDHLHVYAHSQEEGEYEKWKNKNEFQLKDLVDVPDFVDDLKEETGWMYDWKKDDGEEGAEKAEGEKAEGDGSYI